MSFFSKGKKKEDVSSESVVNQVPLKQISDLIGKGLSEKQVIDTLKNEGFSLAIIEKGFNQFKAKEGVKADNAGPVSGMDLKEPLNDLKPSQEMVSVDEPNPFSDGNVSSTPPGVFSPQEVQSAPQEDSSNIIEEIQELVEAVVEERLSDLSDKLEELEGFKTSVDKNINDGLTGFSDLKKKVDSLEKDFNTQRTDFNNLSEELRIELSAMEKALHKLVPQLSASIRGMGKEKVSELDSKKNNDKKKNA